MTSMLPRFRTSLGISALLFGLAASAATGWGQLAPSPDAPPVSTAPAPSPEEESVATFKLEVNLVDVFFTVKAKDGTLAPHLTKDDCTTSDRKSTRLNSSH